MQRLYAGVVPKNAFSLGGRWLMMDVKDEAVQSDVLSLIALRVRPKAKP